MMPKTEIPETKVDAAGGAQPGEPAKPVPGSTREPPPLNPDDPNSPPSPTGVDAKVQTQPVEMPKSEFEGGTNVVGVPAEQPQAQQPPQPPIAPAPRSGGKK